MTEDFHTFAHMSGGLSTFNIADGFCEALVRGYRSGFLKDEDYAAVCGSETLEDVKLYLQETDYNQFLADETGDINAKVIGRKAEEKLVAEFNFLRSQSSGTLTRFLDFIAADYMIENVLLMMKGAMNGRNAEELQAELHPLGEFPPTVTKIICGSGDGGGGSAGGGGELDMEMIQAVLLETAVGGYFATYLEDTRTEGESLPDSLRGTMKDIDPEMINFSVRKLYLEDFYQFVLAVGGETREVMGQLLEAEADRLSISLTLNMTRNELIKQSPNWGEMRSKRALLYPALGKLYPEGTVYHEDIRNLAMVGSSDDPHIEELGNALKPYPDYKAMWEEARDSDLETLQTRRMIHMLELAMDSQMHYGCFYAYVKLKEQEIRNLKYISECILQNQKALIDDYIPVFSEREAKSRRARS